MEYDGVRREGSGGGVDGFEIVVEVLQGADGMTALVRGRTWVLNFFWMAAMR